MADINPYAAPKAAAEHVDDDQQLEKVASGQKLIIVSLVLSFLPLALSGVSKSAIFLVMAIGLLASIVAIIGVFRVGGGLGHSVLSRVFYAIMMFVPLANLVFMIGLSLRATAALRRGGYKVGLLGAKRP